METPIIPTPTPDTAYFYSVYNNMARAHDPSAAIYRVVEPDYMFTLSMIMGKHIAFEGVPSVGKTTLMHSIAHAIKYFGGCVDAHEENADADMLQEFFRDPKRNAFWFQMYKLRGRQMRAQSNEHDLIRGTRMGRIQLEDRDMPGDMAFAIYNHHVGFISDEQMAIYMKEAMLTRFHAPFLVIYPTASPKRLVKRVSMRGDPNEMASYDEAYFITMDACYRAALDICGCTYCVVDWEENLPGVGTPGKWSAEHGMVPMGKCMEVIEKAIAFTYGENIARISAMRDGKHVTLNSTVGCPLDTNYPETLVHEMKRLVSKHSVEMRHSNGLYDSYDSYDDTDDDNATQTLDVIPPRIEIALEVAM
jgi:deoxyadenosine/deoxycytidine kinase